MKKRAFTLVELIVVITILAILATIWFVSFSGYLAWARDTNRVAQLKAMSDALELYSTKKSLPIPDDKVDIKASAKTIAYQWYIWKNVLETIEYTESWLDPKDKQYFSYYLTRNKKYFQLLAFLEEESEDVLVKNTGHPQGAPLQILQKTHATDYSERFPRVTGKKLWILLDSDKNPIQENSVITASWYLDIGGTVNNYVAIFDDGTKIVGTGALLVHLRNVINWGWIAGSCKTLLAKKESLYWEDGVYIIAPWTISPFPAYYDMTTDWGGWTLVSTTLVWSSLHNSSQQVWNFPILLSDFNVTNKKMSDNLINLLRWWNNFSESYLRVDALTTQKSIYLNNQKRFWWDFCWASAFQYMYFSYNDAQKRKNKITSESLNVWHHCWYNIRINSSNEWYIYSSPSWGGSPQWYKIGWYGHTSIKMWVK